MYSSCRQLAERGIRIALELWIGEKFDCGFRNFGIKNLNEIRKRNMNVSLNYQDMEWPGR